VIPRREPVLAERRELEREVETAACGGGEAGFG
jgi:hypothetical protein